MIEEVFLKLEELLTKEIEINNSKKTEIDSNFIKKLKSIENFLDNYPNNFDVELLNDFIDELDFEGLRSADKYKSIINYASFCEKNNINGIFDFDISTTKEIISKLITECKKLLSLKNNYIKREKEKNLKLDEKIKFNKNILSIINKFKTAQFLNPNDYMKLVNYLLTIENHDLSLLVIAYITEANAKYMETEIKKAVLNQTVKNKIEESKSKTNETKLVQNDKQQLVVDSKNNEEKEIKFLTEEQQSLLNEALLISNIKDIAPSVELASSLLDINMTWKERISIYSTIDDITLQKQLIAYDINKNIVPEIEKKIRFKEVNIKMFEILQKALSTYNKLQQQEKEKSKTFLEYLKENNQNETIEFLNKITDLIDTVLQLQSTNSKMFYQLNLGVLVSNLNEDLNSFTDSIELYYQGNVEYLELTEEYRKNLEKSYYNLKNSYENSFIKKDDMIEKGIAFYNSSKPLKNIFFFVNDDDVSSILEEDIENEPQFTDKTYSNVLNKLHLCVSDDFVATGNHKIKTGNYQKSFLEKYKVKSIVNGENRIFYSRFNSNIGEIMGIENFHMVFIYLVGYGNSTTNKKDINATALKRCFDKSDYIDSLINLFNVDLSLLNDAQKEKLREKAINILNQQYAKIGHFVSVCEEKKKKREGASLQ